MFFPADDWLVARPLGRTRAWGFRHIGPMIRFGLCPHSRSTSLWAPARIASGRDAAAMVWLVLDYKDRARCVLVGDGAGARPP